MLAHRPIPGYWYANIVGQLMQVRAVLYEGSLCSRIIYEYINGKRETVDMQGWYRLDLSLHSPGIERRRRQRDRNTSAE